MVYHHLYWFHSQGRVILVLKYTYALLRVRFLAVAMK